LNTKLVVPLIALLLISPLCSLYPTVLAATAQDNISSQPFPGYTLIGQAPASLPVLVNIAIPLKNTGFLSSTLEQVSDPSSPSFRHFLTAPQIEQQFLPKTEDESMLTYLQSIGLPVLMNSLDSMIVVQATAAKVKQYFNADVEMYSNGTQSYYTTTGNSLLNGAHFIASNATALFAQPRITSSSVGVTNDNVTFTEGAFSAKALQTVYNASSLYKQGFQGEGQNIGILDFFGSPTISQDLVQYDNMFNLPNPVFNVFPIITNYPNLGVSTGWSLEVAADVESAHTMAPNAAIDLYTTTSALSFAADLAPIINIDQDNTLAMSFSIAPEWLFSTVGGPLFYFNMLLTDQYFMIGNLEGITFLSSSGDAGGSGYSNGPAGNLGYPDDSPYVTSVGGTQTYLSNQNGSTTFVQTGWSNPAYVPNGVNTGGSGGGVSFLEPKPWYQQNLPTPPSYPNGRMEPDLALQAGLNPGIFFVNGGSTVVIGGTSVSVQLLGGLITIVDQSVGGRLGLINPFLYSLGDDPNLYPKAFDPITFGYSIPWTASYGYNLVTGWGAPNIGEIANLINNVVSQPSLSIFVGLTNSTGQTPNEFTSNQTMDVTANIFYGPFTVTSGIFTAKLVTLTGTSLVTNMIYDSSAQAWNCSITVPQQSGVAYVDVSGTSNGILGEDFVQTFLGYLATFTSPVPTDPWTTAPGLPVVITSTDLNGKSAPINSTTMQVNSYQILTNSYKTEDTINLTAPKISGETKDLTANLASPYTAGPTTLMLQGNTYGFLPFTNGIYLQTSTVTPEVASEPGSAGPGQYLTILTKPVAPVNVASISSIDTGGTVGTDIAAGSNVTAFLLNPQGNVLATATLIKLGSSISGLLKIPVNAQAGLYTIMLQASYGSETLGYTLGGSFYEQVWVSNGIITPKITLSPTTLYMGQNAQITADIQYTNGQEVTQGEYTAIIYPQELQNQYTTIMYNEYLNGQLTQLTYNSSLNRWTAIVTLPSPYNSGVISPVNDNSFYYAGPYEAYVTGISYDGVPTTTQLAAQQNFQIQPYLYLANQLITTLQQNWGLALTGDTITGSQNLANNVFIGSNTLQGGTTTISDSSITGNMIVSGSNLTLQGVYGGNIIATNSTINLINTYVKSLTLTNSSYSMLSSTYQTINPTPPTITITTPTNGTSYTGNINAMITTLANNIASVTVYLNDQQIQASPTNGTLTFIIPSANYPDGTYTMQVIAIQTDGTSSTATTTMYFTNQASTNQNQINTINSTQTALNDQISSLQNNISTLTSSEGSLQNQVANLQGTLSSLASSQSTLQNQLKSMQSKLNNLTSSQTALQNQLGSLGNNLNASISQLHNQTKSLQTSLNNTKTLAYIGIEAVIAGIASVIIVAIIIVAIRHKKTAPNSG
jgi:subtilase family serine protease/chaperonin cofactor prefoldin